MLTFFSFQLYKGRINATSHVIQHPMYGAGHKFRTLHLPVSTTLAEVLDRVSGKFAIVHVLKIQFKKKQNQKTQTPEPKNLHKPSMSNIHICSVHW